MKRVRPYILIFLAILLLLVLVGPFLVPVPPIEGALSPQELAWSQSRFVEINGLQVHYEIAGQGEPFFLLLHGFGASTFTWREIVPDLAQSGTVLSYDRPGFGLTERPLEWQDSNPYSPEESLGLLMGLLDHFGIEKAILVGNSAGGTVALQAALRFPERVEALVLVAPAVYTGGGAPAWIRPLLSAPQICRLGPLFVRRVFGSAEGLVDLAWHDPSQITPEIRAGYERPLQVENWDRALWELTLASQESNLAEELAQVQVHSLIITGDDDRIVPTEESIRLASELPNADLAVIENCGHVPQEECPDKFMEALKEFISNRLGSIIFSDEGGNHGRRKV
ncbi:MAG: alpha/beta hydrolase [Anaerolineales bacterium]|jgi:pimeloyl-ACP methyl ester carboxylesterase